MTGQAQHSEAHEPHGAHPAHSGHEHPDHDPAGGHDHAPRSGPVGFLVGLVRTHSHDDTDSLDEALMVSRAGTRALAISLSGLAVTAMIQLIVFALSGSVGLLADTIHNFADAFTAVPIGLSFVVARRAPNRRYTYGYGRAEDLAGLVVVAVIAASAVIAAWEAVNRLIHPRHVTDLAWVAAAGVVGFLGNELAARYRVRVGRQIGSAALVADGYHARTDGYTSLAVVAGAAGVALGWRLADPIVGLAITMAILTVLRGAARDIYRRLMDAVDPALIDQIEQEASETEGVRHVDDVRVRWLGHELRAELNITVDRDLPVHRAHDVAEAVRHHLLHHVPRLTNTTIHTDPRHNDHNDPHQVTAHHYTARTSTGTAESVRTSSSSPR